MGGAAWLEALADRGGPLFEAGTRFLAEHPGAPPAPIASGVDGLSALADAIDAWAEREDEGDPQLDESFVEGAGAVLALLLLAHVADGSHAARGPVHRLRLGPHGFFDPFGAVERALEAESAVEALVREVGRAEAEAAGAAGVGRAVRLLQEKLSEVRPDLTITEHFEAHVALDAGVELDLSRVLRATDGESDRAAEQAVDKLVAMLPGGSEEGGLPWAEARGRLLPRPCAPGFCESIERVALARRGAAGGALEVTLLLSYDGRSRYVRANELPAWGKTFDEALAHAVENLAVRSSSARFARVETPEGPLVMARSGDGLDGARVLMPTLHDVLAPELGSPFVVAVPHRDALWACAHEPEALRDALRARVRDDAARAPHPVSDALFLLDRQRLRRLD